VTDGLAPESFVDPEQVIGQQVERRRRRDGNQGRSKPEGRSRQKDSTCEHLGALEALGESAVEVESKTRVIESIEGEQRVQGQEE
jgi:hypothetical protein